MKQNWDKAFEQVLKSEGGYVNDNNDRGGETNLGVTRASWGSYKGRPIHDGEMRALTRDMVKPFYKSCYWDKVRGDDLPSGLDYAVFDFAVNAGVSRAIKYLQRAVGVTDDGLIGPVTMAAVSKADPKVVLDKFSRDKATFYLNLVKFDPSQKRFIKGWMARVDHVQEFAEALLG